MKTLVSILCLIALAGCATTPGDAGSMRRAQRSTKRMRHKDARQKEFDRRIYEAHNTLANIYKLSEDEVVARFGKPRSIKQDSSDPQAYWMYYQNSGGRIIEAKIANGIVVDVNYSATGAGGGKGAGRKAKARNAAIKKRKIQEDAARGIVRSMYDAYGPGDIAAYVGVIKEKTTIKNDDDISEIVRSEIAAIIREAEAAREAERQRKIAEAEAARREAEETRIAALEAETLASVAAAKTADVRDVVPLEETDDMESLDNEHA